MKQRVTLLGIIVCLFAVLFLFLAIHPVQANEVVASASGGSQLTIEDMFGFELIDVRAYGFNVVKRAVGLSGRVGISLFAELVSFSV